MTDHASIIDRYAPDALVAEMAALSSKVVSADFLILVEELKQMGVVDAEMQLLSEHLHASRDELREIVWQITARIVENSSSLIPAKIPVRNGIGIRDAA